MIKVKLFQPYVSWRSIWNVAKVLRSGYIAEGEEVVKFEREFGEKFRKQNVVAVNSGTSALELAYELSGIGKGDEVISPVLTCLATNIPIVRRGAKVVFADIKYDLNIDVEDAEKKITKKTKAIVFVHFGGNNRGLNEVEKLCRRRKLILIEDAAQAVGSDHWGIGDYTCVSLQAVKILTSGDGGFLICKNENMAERAKQLRWFGYNRELKRKADKEHPSKASDLQRFPWMVRSLGYKYHMNNISAAIGRGNLSNIYKVVDHHKVIQKCYRWNGINANIWFAYIISQWRDQIWWRLKMEGIESGMYHYRNDSYEILGDHGKLPNMDKIENQYLLLPLHSGVSEKVCQKICDIVNAVL